MSAQPQSFENHAKMVPGYHYVASLLLVLSLGWAVYRVASGYSLDALFGLFLALGVILVFFYARVFALGVQDRLIRLEERLRMERLLPEDLRARIPEFSTGQLIALRFASDAELPDLARRVLSENIRDRKTIKQAVRSWRADEQRI